VTTWEQMKVTTVIALETCQTRLMTLRRICGQNATDAQ